jgi:2-amino-4-hydroxy-6-hydroxymethyldihydropteridine diphosphokinase
MSCLALIGLGSNLGDRRLHLNAAIVALSETPGVAVLEVSSFHDTDPVGGPAGQGKFLNAVALIETTLDPIPLLRVLQEIEVRFGRVRTVQWGPRTLDLDLLLYADRVIQTPELSIPHPRINERRFVLEPLVEVSPAAVDPITKRAFADILADLAPGAG